MPTTPYATWDVSTIVLSYIIAVSGSFCSNIMEQWRLPQHPRRRTFLLLAASVALGGCGIWSMHFTGMQAYELHDSDGKALAVRYEGFSTIASLLLPILGVYIGLRIASRDPFFLEMEQSRRKDIVRKIKVSNCLLLQVVPVTHIVPSSQLVALFYHPWRIILGGVFAALGVLVMHYLGMVALRTKARMSFHTGIVALSCVIALGAASAAFWILFRVLTFWPKVESLRIGSALIMGVAVCGTHYTGMAAASYTSVDDVSEPLHKFRDEWSDFKLGR
ncbi:hypothetical protein ATCC90586_001523 [Pythium insidiosum]|nr:hypothetical protein ATCC90586_001523 [Pythium insidiosum]